VGPRIFDADGVDRTCARRGSTIGRDLADLLVPKKCRPACLGKYVEPSDTVYTLGGEVDFVQGACMAIATRVFRSTGGFNEAIFLYGEEEWLALALAEMGLKPRLAPAAVVYHAGQHSTDQVATFAVEQLHRSRAIIYRALYAKPVALLGVALNVVALIALILTHPVRRPLRFRPVEDPAWCRSALRGLASGLLGRTVDPPTVR
jgi:GT2 family glycosyltransferase